MSHTESAPEHPTQVAPTSPAARAMGGDGTAPLALRPGDKVGRYQVRDLLGAGGMGQVFTAFDPELGRTVALKLIRPDGRAPSSRVRSRFLREAQALAKLQHPNVVAIYDVCTQGEGTQGDEVFIAMELVAGQTLAAWLASALRPWRAIVDVFVAAGRGLAAAHAVGIIHRDFKPSNVIVGADRVVVVDFGLARAHGDESDGGERERRGAATVLDVDLTLTGERVGTPRYMAPEQHTGGPIDAHADQYAFAASLWEALFGAPPFAGGSSAEMLEGIARGPAPPPDDRKIPARVWAALARALALRPSDRWPALADLLAELTHDPAAARRRLLAIIGVSVATIAVPLAFVAGGRSAAPSCAAPATSPWDEATRAEVRAAFLTTGKPYAGDSFERVDAALRARLDSWAKAREDACSATEIRHEQSTALMDARMACLARARDQISAFVGVLRTADARGVDRATGAAASIGDLEACGNAPALTAVLPAPDPLTAAAVAEVEREVARVDSLVLVGRMKEAKAAAPALVERARALGHPPLLARALYELGTIGCETGNPRDGAAALYQAARAAGAGHDDVFAADVYAKLVFCVGAKDKNVQAALALAEAAEAALARAGTPPELRAGLYREEFRLHRQAGDLIVAFGFAELELMSTQRLHGEDHAEVARSLADVGEMLFTFGAYRGALAIYARALPILERTRGPTHPVIAAYLNNMAGIAAASGDLARAAESLERALAMEARNYGPDGGATPSMLRNLANVRELQGQLEVARELAERALALDEKALRPDHPDLSFDMYLLCELAIDRGDVDAAQVLCDKALAIRTTAYGADHPDVADVEVLRARIARKRHDLGNARGLLEKALAVHRKALGARHPYVASDESALAAVLLEAGEAPAALPLLEHALVIQENARDDDADDVVIARTLLAEALVATGNLGRAIYLAERAVAAASARHPRADIDGRTRFALAQALGPAERPRAVALAWQARALLMRSPAAEEVAGVDRWLARR